MTQYRIMLSQSVYWDQKVTVNKELREEYGWIDASLSDREFAIEVAKDRAILSETVDGGKLTVDDVIIEGE